MTKKKYMCNNCFRKFVTLREYKWHVNNIKERGMCTISTYTSKKLKRKKVDKTEKYFEEKFAFNKVKKTNKWNNIDN